MRRAASGGVRGQVGSSCARLEDRAGSCTHSLAWSIAARATNKRASAQRPQSCRAAGSVAEKFRTDCVTLFSAPWLLRRVPIVRFYVLSISGRWSFVYETLRACVLRVDTVFIGVLSWVVPHICALTADE